ncbi:MAG: hypothetical protein IJQ23_02050 [Clostridia bacterium]|nr:hypothetical protein [Clostridia bacterium]
MRYCLIGECLSHSYSANIHKWRGLNYELKEVPREGLTDFIKEGYDGFNVTIPYKKEIIPFLDEVDESAKKIGAVNTVVRRDGKYIGYNTDIEGMRYAVSRKGIFLKDRNVMILGSGGAACTAQALCDKEKAKSCVTVSRNGEINYENCYGLTGTEIIINATPVGMFPNIGVSPVDLSRFNNLKGVFDCIYNPFNTALILQAKKLGIKCSDGLPMLVKQALEAQKLWGIKAADDTEEIINSLYAEKLNIVLIGMPSSGKTTVGKLVAEILGKKFIDTDAEICAATGKTPAEIIETSGEKAFRDIETETINKIAVGAGAVIATGGGAVLRGENVSALKANGVIFYIKRDLSLLTAENRPLSASGGIARLYGERKALYERAADFIVENDGKKADCADQIASIFKNLIYNPKDTGDKI